MLPGANFPSFTPVVLLYGDFPELAKRCIGSICHHLGGRTHDLRIGLNACSTSTCEYVGSLIRQELINPEHVINSRENIRKYPMMRRLLYNDATPITSEYVMWFDDDSYIENSNFMHGLVAGFNGKWAQRHPDMIGGPYTVNLHGNQAEWIKDQPWYTGKPIPVSPSKLSFAQGAWWMAKTAMLKKFNYPFPALSHNGGDVMLGALLAQQGLSLDAYRHGIAINADEKGRESHALRRGVSETPLGVRYVRTAQSKQPPPVVTAPKTAPPVAPSPKWTATLDL